MPDPAKYLPFFLEQYSEYHQPGFRRAEHRYFSGGDILQLSTAFEITRPNEYCARPNSFVRLYDHADFLGGANRGADPGPLVT